MNLRHLTERYSHAWVFLYWLIYLPWFGWLERTVTTGYYVVQSDWDRVIPFCEAFVIPYLFWFPYVAITIAWFFFHDKREFYQLTLYLYAGMTLFLVICTVFPNGTLLRPAILPRDNVFTDLVRLLWKVDTPTNVLPSLHVYNSLVCCVAVLRSQKLYANLWVRVTVPVLTLLIVLSTMFLKQHSVVDVVSATAMAWVLYGVVYQAIPQHNRHMLKDSV